MLILIAVKELERMNEELYKNFTPEHLNKQLYKYIQLENVVFFMKEKGILHYPRLDTVLMVENAIKNAEDYQSRMELWKSLPKKVQYQTFRVILDYLEKSNKIIFTKDKKIVWVFADSNKERKLLRESVKAYV